MVSPDCKVNQKNVRARISTDQYNCHTCYAIQDSTTTFDMAKHFINSLSKCWRSCFFVCGSMACIFLWSVLVLSLLWQKTHQIRLFFLSCVFCSDFFVAFVLGHIWYLIRILDISFKCAGKDMRYLSSKSLLGGICINCNHHTMEHIRLKELNVNQWQQMVFASIKKRSLRGVFNTPL